MGRTKQTQKLSPERKQTLKLRYGTAPMQSIEPGALEQYTRIAYKPKNIKDYMVSMEAEEQLKFVVLNKALEVMEQNDHLMADSVLSRVQLELMKVLIPRILKDPEQRAIVGVPINAINIVMTEAHALPEADTGPAQVSGNHEHEADAAAGGSAEAAAG